MAEDWFYQSVVVVVGIIGLAMLIVTIRKMRRETRLFAALPIIAVLIVLAATGLYLYLAGIRMRWLLGAPFPILGFLLGRAEAKRMRLNLQGRHAVGRRTVAHIVVWGLGYLLAIVAAQMGRAGLHAGGILLMLLGAGMAVGCNFNLLKRQLSLRSEA